MKPRVLIVDDSAFARTVLSRVLRATNKIDVVATARDGTEALEQIAALDPDIVTLDLTMPNLDGIGVLRALGGRARPRVIVVSISSIDTELGAEALALGAIELVTKPTALANDRLLEISEHLTSTILATTISRPTAVAPPAVATPFMTRARSRAEQAETARLGIELVMIGTSTGGPQALSRVISALPADLAAPVAIVLHIPVGYTEALAARLDRLSQLHVVEASHGLELRVGMVVLAKGGYHLRIVRHGGALVAELSHEPARSFTPSVDELFLSGARTVGRRGLGVVLTGMGDDGLVGSKAIAAAGGRLLVESESTCVVYGMPRTVNEAEIGAVSAPLDLIADEIVYRV